MLSPGLRIDTERSLLEFDGVVAIDCHHPDTPDVYLELVVCAPDTREHESLVVTDVPPSLIHAGLLALGFEPGRPAAFRFESEPVRLPPTGDPVSVEFIYEDEGTTRRADATDWITDAQTRSNRLSGGWVFAGSRFVERGGPLVYDADGAGTVVGLTSFGSETIALGVVISPETSIDEPVWIADPAMVPAQGTPVRVRLSPR